MTIRHYLAVSSVSIVALIGVSTGLAGTAYGQGAASSVASGKEQSTPRVDPIASAVASVNPSDTVKAQIDAIIEKYAKERESLSPSSAPGTATGRPQLTPEQREKLAASEAKEVAEIKAVLPADQQAKFQTAYDAAKLAQASAPTLALLSERLSLTEDEKTKITPIIADFTVQSQKLRQDSTLDRDARREKQTALWEATKAKIRPLLPSDKQSKLDAITAPRGGRPGGNAGSGGAAPSGQ